MSPWWRGAVLYQIYPRSFQDSDGDGVGDLKGIAARLEYVAGLGVDGIWISPVFASPMRDFGYDISDYRAIDPLFGTLKDFDAVIERAHSLGLKVIVDQVYSHTSDQHPWFVESRSSRDNPKADWYVWADAKIDGAPPNNWQATFGGASWTWDSRRRQYYLHNYLVEQPDLNLHNAQVREALLEVARFWLKRGVDGFRLDVANCYTHDRRLRDNPPSGLRDAVKPYAMQTHVYDRDRPESLAFAARLRALVDEKPDRFTLAEIASDRPVEVMAEYTSGPDRFHTAYSFVFLGDRFGARAIREGVEQLLAASKTAWPSWAFSNHDVMRVATRWGAGKPQPQWSKLMLALLTTLRGTAFVYQGEELGLPEAEVPLERLRDPDGIAFWPAYKGRDGCRTPMPWERDAPQFGFTTGEPWLPASRAHKTLAVDRQTRDKKSSLNFTRSWLAWRRDQAALRTGAIRFLDLPGEVLGFVRTEGDDVLACLFNLGDRDAEFAWPASEDMAELEGWTEAYPLGGAREGERVKLPVAAGMILRRS